MKRAISRFFGLALVLSLTAVLPARAQSAAGDWELNVDSPQGALAVTLALQLDGEKASGSLTSMVGTMPVTGTLTAGKLELSGTLEAQGMSLALGMAGTVAGDSVSGTMKLGDFGEFPFSGKRAAKAAAASPAPATPAPATPAPGGATTASGVAGKWNLTLTLAGMGELPMAADFKQEGSDVTGTLNSMVGEVAVKGTFSGTSLKLEFTAETPQGPLPVTMTGDLTDSGLAGTATITGLGEAQWKAVRP